MQEQPVREPARDARGHFVVHLVGDVGAAVARGEAHRPASGHPVVVAAPRRLQKRSPRLDDVRDTLGIAAEHRVAEAIAVADGRLRAVDVPDLGDPGHALAHPDRVDRQVERELDRSLHVSGERDVAHGMALLAPRPAGRRLPQAEPGGHARAAGPTTPVPLVANAAARRPASITYAPASPITASASGTAGSWCYRQPLPQPAER